MARCLGGERETGEVTAGSHKSAEVEETKAPQGCAEYWVAFKPGTTRGEKGRKRLQAAEQFGEVGTSKSGKARLSQPLLAPLTILPISLSSKGYER